MDTRMKKEELWKQIQERAPDLAAFLKQSRKDWPNYELVDVRWKEEINNG
jgi:hypothetical protein